MLFTKIKIDIEKKVKVTKALDSYYVHNVPHLEHWLNAVRSGLISGLILLFFTTVLNVVEKSRDKNYFKLKIAVNVVACKYSSRIIDAAHDFTALHQSQHI